MASGRKKYVPKDLIDELNDIQAEHKIIKDSEAMRRMVDYSQLGRELERLMKFDFRHKPRKRRLFK